MALFDNSYARLPERFYARLTPTKVGAPRLVKVNRALAELLGWPEDFARADVHAGNVVPEGAEPIALAYAGHQFGSFVPQLGDGRAILLGEVVGKDGKRRDVQLKGSGPTPFSRGGDGRAALGPVLREYVVSEAMAELGIPTTRTLAAATTGEPVYREEVLPGAVLTRVAASHLRVGTFQYFAVRNDDDALAELVRYALDRHYPDADRSRGDALALLDCVIDAQASLVARWLGVGFIHGVMNTDNTSISGETIDYGPCAFLDEYHPAKRFSSIDHGGRYAFANQPRMALFNLARLAEALLPLITDDREDGARIATAVLERFSPAFGAAYERVFGDKLGIRDLGSEEGDVALLEDLLARLAAHEVDFTLFFRALCASAEDPAMDSNTAGLFRDPRVFGQWATRWRARLDRDARSAAERAASMRRANPALIPRNHRIEEAIVAARAGDFAPFETLVEALATPYEERPEHAHLAEPPQPEERIAQTFCGT